MNKKRISIWGATGSIGTQTLDIVRENPERFEVVALTGHSNVDLLFQQAQEFRPASVICTGVVDADAWKSRFASIDVQLRLGKDALLDQAASGVEDMVVNGLVGAVGLEATLKAIHAGVDIALANKEVLVMAGQLVNEALRKSSVRLLPVDSEHSAVFQALQGENQQEIRRIVLTASGGPFRGKSIGDLKDVTVEQALAHPNWSMGSKITIDSATMMNKALEIIEAKWLFDVRPEQIEVVIHPQSIIHSMVEFIDGSIKAQLSVPDMRVPIAYALTYPEHLKGQWGSLNFEQYQKMEFYPPDFNTFSGLKLAYQVLEKGGTAPAVLNGADEEAVQLFLDGRILFLQITDLIEATLSRHELIPSPTLEEIIEADQWARKFVRSKL
jgi:1-deoxy-D-xylulose-5-phosphate reductoisomerase